MLGSHQTKKDAVVEQKLIVNSTVYFVQLHISLIFIRHYEKKNCQFDLHSFDEFSGRRKIQPPENNFQRRTICFVKLQCSVFIRQPARFFLSKKNHQMKSGQNKTCDITKTSGLVQVCLKS